MDALVEAPALLAGRYQLAERLGVGPTGAFYRCFDRELEEWIGLKLLRPRLTAHEDARAALRRQVRLARRVTHRNVARIFELGRDGEQQFVTMELIASETLQTRLARVGRLPPEQVPGLAIDLCKGLVAAHAVGVVHGDLHPGVILLAPGRGAVIADLGISRGLGAQLGPHAAPELHAGAPPSARADLYALGAVLFEVLTGRSPWRAGLHAHAPDTRPTGLTGDWLALIDACLHPHPEDRPPDAQAVLARLIALYRGTGHVAMSLGDDGEEPTAPLGSGLGARWLAVHPFSVDDPAVASDSAWVTADLVEALRHMRSLRVVSHGTAPTPARRPRSTAACSG